MVISWVVERKQKFDVGAVRRDWRKKIEDLECSKLMWNICLKLSSYKGFITYPWYFRYHPFQSSVSVIERSDHIPVFSGIGPTMNWFQIEKSLLNNDFLIHQLFWGHFFYVIAPIICFSFRSQFLERRRNFIILVMRKY